MPTSEEILKYEFDAEEGSFILTARCDLKWDKVAFSKLTKAMFQVAMSRRHSEDIPRWIALGFWYCDTWLKDWTSHPDFPRPEQEYYDRSCRLIFDLSSLLFTGQIPYQDDSLEKLVEYVAS